MTEEKTEGRSNFTRQKQFVYKKNVLAKLSKEHLKHFDEDYRNDKKNLLAQSTCCQQPLVDVIVDRQTRHSSIHVFNTKVDEKIVCFFERKILRLDFLGRSTSNKSKSFGSLLDICLFKCHANSIDENIENYRIGIESKLSFLL